MEIPQSAQRTTGIYLACIMIVGWETKYNNIKITGTFYSLLPHLGNLTMLVKRDFFLPSLRVMISPPELQATELAPTLPLIKCQISCRLLITASSIFTGLIIENFVQLVICAPFKASKLTGDAFVEKVM